MTATTTGFVPRHWQELRFDKAEPSEEQLQFRQSIDALIREHAPEAFDRERMADRKLSLAVSLLLDNALAQDGMTLDALSRRELHSLIVALTPIAQSLLELAGCQPLIAHVTAGSLRQIRPPRRERLILAEMAYHYAMAWQFPHAASALDMIRGVGKPTGLRRPGIAVATLQSMVLNQIENPSAHAWPLLCTQLRRILDTGQREGSEEIPPEGAEWFDPDYVSVEEQRVHWLHRRAQRDAQKRDLVSHRWR